MLKIPLSVRNPVAAGIVLLLLVSSPNPAQAQHGQMTPVVGDYFKQVFAGDVSNARTLFAGSPGDPGAKMLAERFDGRFVERTDGLDLAAIETPVVKTIIELFQDYWRDALMQTAPRDALDDRLEVALDRILVAHGYASALGDEDGLFDNVEALILASGYFAKSGRTPPLYDLMIWTTNDTATESVELTDGTWDVEVNYLDNFVSYGWSNFAAFGMTSTGGWAEKDGLFCVCRHYDLDSERFKLSFLKHETRHLVDLALYPELQAADLEYRGKLSELAFAEDGIYPLMAYFQNASNRVEDAPHPLANWYVIEGLSRLLLDGERPAEATAWASVPKDEIRQAARQLLDEHNVALADMGPKTAKGIVKL